MDTEILFKILAASIVYIITRLLVKHILPWRQHPPTPPLPPGPKGWPILGCLPLLGTNPHVSLAQLSITFGPMMHLKLGTCDVVVASSPSMAKAFLKTLDRSFVNRPLGAASNYIGYDSSDLLFAEFGPRWKLLRKLSNLHMLGAASFGEWAMLRRTEIGHMVRDMCEMSREGEQVPVLEFVSCALANIIGQKCISRRVFASHGQESNDFKDMVVELTRLAGLFNIGDFIPWIEAMDLQGIQGKMKRLHDKFDVLITEMLEEHVRTASEREGNPDFFDVVVGIEGDDVDGVKLTMTNYKALLLNMFIGGTDTSSCTVEWAVAEMLHNPTILARLQTEIDEVIGKNRRLEESDVARLPYLQAICKETFRKHPVAPLNVPRLTSEPCQANGYYIPKNTRLYVNVWAMGCDPEIWENPQLFDPNRFLNEKNQQIEPWGTDFELIPFGAGRRICPGIRMGIVMVQFVIGTLAHSFDWKIHDGSKIEMGETFGLVLRKAERLKAIINPRLEPTAYKG